MNEWPSHEAGGQLSCTDAPERGLTLETAKQAEAHGTLMWASMSVSLENIQIP